MFLTVGASPVAVHGLSCLWDLPRPGIEPVSPALAGGFLTTGPPGKSTLVTFDVLFWRPQGEQRVCSLMNHLESAS